MWVRWIENVEKGEYGEWHHVQAALTINTTCGKLMPSVMQERHFDFNSESIVCEDCAKLVEVPRGS